MAVGETGEVVCRGAIVSSGYYNRPDATAETFRNGWLHTGDVGYLDEDGYLYLQDRQHDMIISGGFNVYPREVEDVLVTHPAVREAAVVSVPDTRWGEIVHAVVSVRAAVTPDELEEYMRDRVAGFKRPRAFHIREQDLPEERRGQAVAPHRTGRDQGGAAMSSDMEIDEFTALHGLVLKKAGQAGEVAEVLGATEAEVAPALDAAVAEKRAMSGRGKYMVTPAGRAWLDEQYPVLFADLRADPGADAAYAGFEEVNRELLALMTRWQTVNVGGEAVPNDHSDAEYDAAVLDQLAKLDSDADPVLDVLAGLVPRLGVHRRRLAEALARASAGETDYVSGVRVASYHTVWFELHEDLLRLLGRTREP